ncbi:MAG: Lrp/AsnC family transcriptional regulator [Gammaproteobacteria bacterium]|nr:Lrp/AsnC family transcriptional regulator [Gammaproteobacteria bacterium]
MSRSQSVDEIDIAIIRMLQKDGRRSYADIAAELKLAPSTVQQRANRLIDANLIKIRAVTDPMMLGVPITASMSFKVDGSRLRSVADTISQFDEVGWVAICTGSFDLMCEVACKNNEHLIDLIAKLSKIAGIRSTETFIYLHIVKNTYQWGVP